jgi:hypothetical protein
MADDVPTQAASTTQTLEDRIRALEAELAATRQEIHRRERPTPRPEGCRASHQDRDLSDDAQRAADRTVDEMSRFFRTMTTAYVEGLRSAADAVGAFSDELTQRHDGDGERDDRERVGRLPEDMVASYLKAMRRALTISERTLDRFQDEYKDERAQGQDTDRDEHRDAPR